MSKDEIIAKLGLHPLPGEGGYFRETYRSARTASAGALGIDGTGDRPLGTAIFYLVTPTEFSALHRLKFDEVFHFYLGDAVEMLQLDEKSGQTKKIVLGSDILRGQHLQAVVPHGTWQGTRLVEGGQWALLGTTMAPGFDFADFELGLRALLLDKFPAERSGILALTRA